MSRTAPIVWINNELVTAEETGISPFDHGLLTGNGAFETLRLYHGTPFALRRHWERLARSAGALGLKAPSREAVAAAVKAVVEANKQENGRVRITLTGGPAPLGSDRGDAPPTLIVATGDLPDRGAFARLVTVGYRRNEFGALTSHKTTSYAENVIALAEAKAKGGTEALFTNTQGHLCEGSGSNVFVVVDGGLITSTLSSGCLPGITRALTLERCAGEGIAVQEADHPPAILAKCTEAFVTSSLREIQPVEKIDGRPLPHCPGPVTERLQACYRFLTETEPDP